MTKILRLIPCYTFGMDHSYQTSDSYFRQRHFDFYRHNPNPFYAVTFELEVGPLKTFSKQHQQSIYLNMCYLFTQAMQEIPAFRYRLLEDRLILYNQLHPSMIVPLDDGTYCFARPSYAENLFAFHQTAEPAIAHAKQTRNLDNPEHGNFVFFTSLPKIAFTGLTHVSPPRTTDGEPQISFGKFFTRDQRQWVPVGIGVNHLFIDGQALSEMVGRTEELFFNPMSPGP